MKSYTELIMQEEFDVEDAPAPTSRFILVGSPRTGSNLLADLLRSVGIGIPAEYFAPNVIDDLMTDWGCYGPMDYITEVFSRRTALTGIFGTKAMNPGEWQRALDAVWPQHVIYIVREDKDAQVESLARAMRTKYFADVGDERPVIVPDANDELRAAAEHIAETEAWFVKNGVASGATITVSYEYLVANPDDVVRNIALAFGISLPDDWTHDTPLVRKLPGADGVIDLSKVVT